MNHKNARVGVVLDGQIPDTLHALYPADDLGIELKCDFYIDRDCSVTGLIFEDNGVRQWRVMYTPKQVTQGDVFHVTYCPMRDSTYVYRAGPIIDSVHSVSHKHDVNACPEPTPTKNKVTVDDIEAEIVDENYFTAAEGVSGAGFVIHDSNVKSPLSLLTFCVLVLKNGFTVTGESACVDPANFDAQMGRDIARKKAIDKMWPLLGWRLADSRS